MRYVTVAAILATVACGAPPASAPPTPGADDRVKVLADAYLAGWFDRNPDQGTFYGVPGRHHDQLPDNTLQSLAEWQKKEDAWLADAAAIDPSSLQSEPLKGTYAIV